MPQTEYPLTSVLVVGGCGFLGHHIVKLLVSQHPEASISVLDLNTSTNRVVADAGQPVEYYNGDITNKEDMLSALRKSKAEVVINTVSPIAVGEVTAKVFEKVNVEGTKTTLEAAMEEKVKVYVYTSSASVAADNMTDRKNVNEDWPAEKHLEPYADSKAKGEALVLEANGKNGLRTCSLRVASLFGGHGDRQMIPNMLNVLKSGQTKFQIGNNDNLFDFTYIENAAYAHILAAERLLHHDRYVTSGPDKNVAGEAFFITNGEPVYFWDFPRAIWGYYGHVAPYYIKLPFALGTILATLAEWYSALVRKEPGLTRFRVNFTCRHRYFDIRKAKHRLEYQPLVPLYDGLFKSCEWFCQEEAKKTEKKEQ